MTKPIILSVRFTEHDMENIRRIAELHQCTVSDYVRNAVMDRIENQRSWVRFVCESCKNGTHDNCMGSAQCDCQHRKPRV